jgi:hypothetical protein
MHLFPSPGLEARHNVPLASTRVTKRRTAAFPFILVRHPSVPSDSDLANSPKHVFADTGSR